MTPEHLKNLGNESIKNQKFEEAILHYTYAIKLDPSNYTLYSNRSYAFLKVHQYYFALEDANETIKLNPSWPKVLTIGFIDSNFLMFLSCFRDIFAREK